MVLAEYPVIMKHGGSSKIMNDLETIKVFQLLPDSVSKVYQYDIRTFNTWAAGRPITSELVQEYFEHLREIGRKPSTIGRQKVSIKAALLSLRGNGLTLSESAKLDTFFKSIKSGTRKTAVTEDAVLTRKEFEQLTLKAGKKTSLIIRALFETAARVSELTSITLKNCKRKPHGIEITIIGKGNKEGVFFLPVNLFDEIKQTFKSRVYLFEVKHGKAISRKTIHTLIKRASIHIDRYDIHAHTLRHTWATLSMPKLGLAKVSKYLRHATPETTARYYLHGQASIEEVLKNNNQIMGE